MFITFEGIEGCGKSTQASRLFKWLEGRGRRVVLTREPGGTGIGRTLREILLAAANTNLAARAELFLYLADRAQHVHELIRPALEQGILVLADRFVDSTLVYQGHGRGLSLSLLQDLNELAVDGVEPDITFLLDVPPETGLDRARSRNCASGTEEAEGRFEAESLEFHHRIREGYLELAAREPGRIRVLDGTKPEDEVFAAIQHEMEKRLKG